MRKAEPIAGLGGLILLASLFLPWNAHETGWQAMSVIDVVLALLALLALAVPVTSVATQGPAKAIGTALLASAFVWPAIVLVAVKLLSDSGSGAWLALAGSIVAWAGSWFSLKDESTPGAAVPDVPRRPAPPAQPA
jgi:hypothetical protein